jgi:hypothetical protein
MPLQKMQAWTLSVSASNLRTNFPVTAWSKCWSGRWMNSKVFGSR